MNSKFRNSHNFWLLKEDFSNINLIDTYWEKLKNATAKTDKWNEKDDCQTNFLSRLIVKREIVKIDFNQNILISFELLNFFYCNY